MRLDFTGKVTDLNNKESQNIFNKGDIYTILPPITVKSIVKNTPLNQHTKDNFITWKITFDRALNSSSVSESDFSLTSVSGQKSGFIISAFGFNDTYFVSVAGIDKDAELRLDFTGFVEDNNGIFGFTPFLTGETYIIDFTPPTLDFVRLSSNNKDDETIAYPKETVTVDFIANENINIISSNINGVPGINSSGGTKSGNSRYTFNFTDDEGPVLFSVTISDLAGNISTFSSTTDGSFVNFIIPPPEVLLISQPDDIIECEGTVDQFLFVIAAPSDKKLNVVYRWWKDGRPFSDWIPDFGQYNFDTLTFDMSGKYKAEIFVYDRNYNRGPFNYLDAKVSETVFTNEVNLYVLQKPSFLRDIKSYVANYRENLTITFDANIYGEHNMEDPTYWTKIDWYKGNIELENNDRIAGADGSILTISGIISDYYANNYRVRLIGECDTVWSNNFVISEEPFANIILEPIDVEDCVGEIVEFSVEAETNIQNSILTYQWMVDDTPIIDEVGKFSGANTSKLNVTLNTDLNFDGSEEFTCYVWVVGYPDNGMKSVPALIFWKDIPVFTMDLAPNYSAKEDEDIEMYVTVTGENLTYTWTHNGNDLGIDNDTLTLTSLAITDAGEYVVNVSNECGEVSSITAMLEVTTGPVITDVEQEFADGVINIYPNPLTSNSILNIRPEITGDVSVILSDLLGNRLADLYNGKVLQDENRAINLNIDKLGLNSGTYYLNIRIGDDIETRQISIVK